MSASKKSIRVLVLDDDQGIRTLLEHAFRKQRWHVTTAVNGRLGLRALLLNTFDVAVVDIRMQEMDGFTFIREAKKIWPWQAFVVISGYLDDESRAMAKSENVRRLFAKPLDLDELIKAVAEEATHPESFMTSPANPRLTSRDVIGSQLQLMRHITRDALSARDLPTALNNLRETILDIAPCQAIGILAIEDPDEPFMMIHHAQALPAGCASQFKQSIIERYQAISGEKVNASFLRVEKTGQAEDPGAGDPFRSIASVPVIAGERVQGLLALGSKADNAFDQITVATLYHTASVISTMLNAFGEMRALATRDALTGLYNRRHFDEELARSWQLSNRYQHPMALLMMDIDQFKDVNDRRGHQAGDQILREFVAAISTHVRSTDLFARFGGDEFVLILPHANEQEATGLAHRILNTIRSSQFLKNQGGLYLTTSIGVGINNPALPLLSHEELLREADQALYRAKDLGRNTCVVWKQSATDGALSIQETPQKASRGRILVLDDEESILKVVKRLLEKEDFTVETTGTMTECLQIIRDRPNDADILLCDLSLRDGHGLDVIRAAVDLAPDMISMVITGNATIENAISAMRQGAYDFVTKPIQRDVLVVALDRAMQYRKLVAENTRYREHLEEMVRVKNTELTGALEDIKKSYEFSLETMVAMLDAREYETGQHSLRVRELTMALASFMGYEGTILEEIGRGALLHDIGKVGIPDAVLLKPGKLTEDEWAIMRRHPEIGYRFVKGSDYLRTSAGIVLSHHEAWDGSGYPHGLKGEAIDPGARIFSVIDSYDAMRSPRIYKKSISQQESLAEIKRKSGTHFDPAVVEKFESFIAEIERIGRWPD
jgi:diguanylate cyclase (GGDEF)-like protein